MAISVTTLYSRTQAENTHCAANWSLELPNGLCLTYGQINELAGDYYETYDPISDGTTPEDRRKRFLAAWYWLAEDKTRNPTKAERLIQILSIEAEDVKKALKKCEDPWEAYSKEIPGVNLKLLAATECRPWNFPGYLGIKWDYFRDDARTAYSTGHAAAIQVVKNGNLKLAYAMNALRTTI